MGANKIKEFWQFFLSQTKSVWVFILGSTWSNKMSNQERIGLEGMIKAYAGCSRIIATTQRASSTELPAESGEKRRRAVPVKVRPFCASKQQKKRPFSLTQNRPPKTGKVAA
jgi:hypothetical protein